MNDNKRARQTRQEGEESRSEATNQLSQDQSISVGQSEGLQDTASQADDNTQRGDSWNDDQTREMSGGGEESFYRNHERGNMDEDRSSDEGGGSLY